MIIHDGKRAAAQIIGKMSGGGEAESDGEGPDDLKAIAEDMIMAFEKKDAMMLCTALQAFMGSIKDEDEEQDQSEMTG